ncbi:hypothetical protein U2F10_02885 [Leptothoe sp. EHU-05/26/07-4]
MASPTPIPSTPSTPSITIPVSANPNQSQAQLQSFLMALVHSYGLTNVLESLSNGMFSHFEETLEESEISTPILEALGTAHTVSKFVLKKPSDS